MPSPKPSLPLAPDAPIDLGDLRALRVGAVVVAVFDERPHGRGLVFSGPAEVGSIDERRIQVVKRGGSGKVIGAYERNTGRTLIRLGGPMFYLSANPEHIALAEAASAEAAAKAAIDAAAYNARLQLAKPVGDDLAMEEADAVSHALAERLTAEQITALAGWLKL